MDLAVITLGRKETLDVRVCLTIRLALHMGFEAKSL